MGEALAAYLQTIGIRTRIRTMERAALTTAWREQKLKNVIVGITGAGGNAPRGSKPTSARTASTPPASCPRSRISSSARRASSTVKKREALIHQIQQILYDRVIHVPIYELAFIWGVGPRVEEPGISLIRSYAYSAPLEDVKLKRPSTSMPVRERSARAIRSGSPGTSTGAGSAGGEAFT